MGIVVQSKSHGFPSALLINPKSEFRNYFRNLLVLVTLIYNSFCGIIYIFVSRHT